MMTEDNRYTIDVEEETQENAVFFDKEFFVCFADDTDKLLELINAYNIKDNELIIKINELEDEIQRLNETIERLYESDKSLRELCSNITHNWSGICVKQDLFHETLKTLKELGCDDLVDDLNKTSIVTGVNGC